MADAIICASCDHFFDPTDKRAYIPDPPDPRYGPQCPACTMEELCGDKAWAVWNSCNGVFEVAMSRQGAVERLAEYLDCECRVVPVRVYTEPEDRWDFREWVDRREHPTIGDDAQQGAGHA